MIEFKSSTKNKYDVICEKNPINHKYFIPSIKIKPIAICRKMTDTFVRRKNYDYLS